MRELAMQLLDKPQRMTGPVEKIWIPECDVLGATVHLLTNVVEHNIALDNPKATAVDRNNRTVTAEMLASPGRLGVTDHPHRIADDQRCIAVQSRQTGS